MTDQSKKAEGCDCGGEHDYQCHGHPDAPKPDQPPADEGRPAIQEAPRGEEYAIGYDPARFQDDGALVVQKDSTILCVLHGNDAKVIQDVLQAQAKKHESELMEARKEERARCIDEIDKEAWALALKPTDHTALLAALEDKYIDQLEGEVI